MRHIYLLGALLFCLNAGAQNVTPAEQLEYVIEEFKLPGGQLGNQVDAIVQGPGRFIWFGTHGGLHRYDGHEFITYGPIPADTVGETTSLTFPYVENLYWDKAGMLWVCTYGDGVFRFDPSTEIFKHFKSIKEDSSSLSHENATAAIEDADGNLWIGTDRGLNRFDPVTGKFKRYYANPSVAGALANDDIRMLYVDKAGTLWTGTGFVFFTQERGSLSRYDPSSDSFVNYTYDPGDKTSLWGNSVRGITEDSKGNFWVASYSGLSRFDRSTGKFERMERDRSLPHAPGTFEGRVAVPYPVLEDQAGGIWVGALFNLSASSNLVRFNTETGKSQIYPLLTSVWGMSESSDGTIWVCGAGAGPTYKVFPKVKTYNLLRGEEALGRFYESEVFKKLVTGAPVTSTLDDIVVDKKRDRVWIEGRVARGMNDATLVLGYYDRASRTGTVYDLSEIKLHIDGKPAASWASHGMAIDSAGGIWGVVPSDSAAIYRFDPEKKSTQQFVHRAGDSTSLSSNNIVAMMMDSRGEVWAASYEAGLNRLNPKTGKVRQYHFDTQAEYDFPIAIMESDDGKIWVGGSFGDKGTSYLAEIDPFTDKIRRVKFPNRNSIVDVRNLTQSPLNRRIFFSIENGGIGQYDYERNEVTEVPNLEEINGVVDIEIDKNGVGWIAFARGFLRIEPTGQAFSFKEATDPAVQARSGFVGEDGHIYFVTDVGRWIEIDPDETTPDTSPDSLRVELVDLFVQGEKQRPGAGNFLTKPIWDLDELTFSHDVGSFLFRFSDFDFQKSTSQFLFRLYPYETEWNQTTISPTANYYRVPPGQYTFQVKSIGQSGGQDSIKEIKVTIAPPWWKSWWAYSVYALGFCVGAVAVHGTQRARVLRHERERTKDRELAQAREVEKAYRELKATQSQLVQAEKMASLGELTAGIAHEIQNPLNFVNNFSELNSELISEMKDAIKKGNTENAETIANEIDDNEKKIVMHGKRADAIVKSMLQHSRKSNGQKELTDLNQLCDEYLRLSYHGLRAKDRSFNAKFETHLDPTLPQINIIPQDFGRVILNLINNAFYAVSERLKLKQPGYEPTVVLATKKVGDAVEIRISDNGIGIAASVKDKIFQPFFTTKPSGQGTGLGLSLAYDIVRKGHGGDLKVESTEGEGTVFTIAIPIA